MLIVAKIMEILRCADEVEIVVAGIGAFGV
jgi:hypothetical protein